MVEVKGWWRGEVDRIGGEHKKGGTGGEGGRSEGIGGRRMLRVSRKAIGSSAGTEGGEED